MLLFAAPFRLMSLIDIFIFRCDIMRRYFARCHMPDYFSAAAWAACCLMIACYFRCWYFYCLFDIWYVFFYLRHMLFYCIISFFCFVIIEYLLFAVSTPLFLPLMLRLLFSPLDAWFFYFASIDADALMPALFLFLRRYACRFFLSIFLFSHGFLIVFAMLPPTLRLFRWADIAAIWLRAVMPSLRCWLIFYRHALSRLYYLLIRYTATSLLLAADGFSVIFHYYAFFEPPFISLSRFTAIDCCLLLPPLRRCATFH